MNDTQVIIIVIGILRQALDSMGLNDVLILQDYQPTQQGVPEARVVYLHKLNTPRYGHPIKKSVYNSTTGEFDVNESFWRVPSWQVSTRAQQDPEDLTGLTSSDLADTVADILQMSSTRETLLQSEIGIERITQVRILHEVNDKDRFEETPSFDFTLSYKKTYVSTVPAVDIVEANVNGI